MRHAVPFLLALCFTASACGPPSAQYELIDPATLPQKVSSSYPAPGRSPPIDNRTLPSSSTTMFPFVTRLKVFFRRLSARLLELGWSPQAELSVQSPLLPRPQIAWQHFYDADRKPVGMVAQLVLAWRDRADNVTAYEFRYTSPSQSPHSVLTSPENQHPSRLCSVFLPAPVAKAWAADVNAFSRTTPDAK